MQIKIRKAMKEPITIPAIGPLSSAGLKSKFLLPLLGASVGVAVGTAVGTKDGTAGTADGTASYPLPPATFAQAL